MSTTIHVLLSEALLCFAGMCHPALVGPDTPHGAFQLRRLEVSAPQYGGDVLEFARDGRGGVFAIHRPPSPVREQLLRRTQRPPVTNGCINVSHEVYEQLRACCTGWRLEIIP